MDKNIEFYDYADSDGFLLPSGENGILFNVTFLLLQDLIFKRLSVEQASLKENITLDSIYHTLMRGRKVGQLYASGNGEPFSHDNMTAMAVFKSAYGEKVDLFSSQPFHRIHPRDLIFYAYCSGGVLRLLSLPFLPLLFIIMFITLIPQNETLWDGRVVKRTSGLILVLLRAHILKFKWFINFVNFVVLKFHGGWYNIFKIYYIEENHPNVQLAKLLDLQLKRS